MINRTTPALLSLWVLSGCAVVRATQQQPSQSLSVAHAATFYVQPLRFQIDQTWEDPQKWAQHVDAWTRAYGEGVRAYAGSTLRGRVVQLLAPGQAIADGIVVDARVSSIRRTSAGAFGTDHLKGEVLFVDARTGERLLAAKVDATSDRVGPEGWTFGGRVKFCSLNLAKGVVLAMKDGHFPH